MDAISASPRPAAMPSLAWACSSPRRGFTLIEMLVVIVIIGILAGLITGAAIAARNKAKAAAISLEISQLDMALKEYKNKFGDYPPDFWGVERTDAVGTQARAAVLRHLRIAFPRYTPGTSPGSPSATPWQKLQRDIKWATNNKLDPEELDPSSALVFWLGGLPASGGATKLMGLCADPTNPFSRTGSRLPPLFEFDERRVDVSGDCPTYRAHADSTPYVYFRARKTTDERWEYGVEVPPDSGTFIPFRWEDPEKDESVCHPYLEFTVDDDDPAVTDTVRRWMNLNSFQIISPGLDNRFGCDDASPPAPFKYAPTGYGFCPEGYEHDNITNFSGGTLEDAME